MMGCSSWATADDAMKQRNNEVTMKGRSARQCVMSFMVSSIGDHSRCEMPSTAKALLIHRSIYPSRMWVDLQRGDDFVEVMENPDFVGGLDARIEIGIRAGDNFNEKLVAGVVGKDGVVAIQVAGAQGGRAPLPPVKDEALSGCYAGGVSVIGESDERIADLG